MNTIQNAEKEFEEYLYYGSNEWLLQFRSYLDRVIEERKNYSHEIYFLIFNKTENSQPDHKSICFTSKPVALLKHEEHKILSLTGVSYKYYKVYLRRLEDNYTILLANKMEKTLIEVTLDYFKLINSKNE